MKMNEMLKIVLPSIITAAVSIIAIIVSYLSSRNSLKRSHENNVESMHFSQKDKVADQIAEKAAALLTKCNPNSLNTVINDIIPRKISHEENRKIRKDLLQLSDDIQTLSNIIKMLSYSIFDSKQYLMKFEALANQLDLVVEMCSVMLLKLSNIYSSMTPEGEIRNVNVMDEVRSLERNFSEEYKEPYIILSALLSDMIWYIRDLSIPSEKKHMQKKNQNRKKKKNS